MKEEAICRRVAPGKDPRAWPHGLPRLHTLDSGSRKATAGFLLLRMPASRISYCMRKRTQQFVPSAVFLEELASDETTPNACVHVCRLAAGEVKREVAVYMAIVHAVAHHSKR